MKKILICAILSLASAVAFAGDLATRKAASDGQDAALANPSSPDSADVQTLRVISDPFTLALIQAAEKHFHVSCHKPTLKTADSLVKWTCLSNMACTYKITVTCDSKKAPHAPRLEMTISGFDDGTAEVESVHFKNIEQ